MSDEKNEGLEAVEFPVTQTGSTFAERKAAREKSSKSSDTKKVDADEVEDKAVKSATKKRTAPKS